MDNNLKIKNLEHIINQYKLNYTSNIINLIKYEETCSILRYRISQLENQIDNLINENTNLKIQINTNLANNNLTFFNNFIETIKKYYNYYINYNKKKN